jgi:hypothetical protein
VKRVRDGQKLFDIFTKIVIGFAFLALALSFVDFAWGFDPVGLNSTWSDVETCGGLAAGAVFLNLIGNGFYRLIARYGPSDV